MGMLLQSNSHNGGQLASCFRRCRSQEAAVGRWHGRRPRVRAQAGGRPKLSVVELLVLLQAGQEASAEDQTAMVEQLWSMAYCVPGVLTASGGSLTHPAAPVAADGARSSAVAGFTHMVHFRLGNAAQAGAFMQYPSVKGMLTVAPPPTSSPIQDLICTRVSVLAYTASIESEMDALFRRGPEYENGEDLVLLLQSTRSKPASDADAFLSQLALLAQSSLAGAVQVTYGPVVPVPGSSTAAAPDAGWADIISNSSGDGGASIPGYVFMARFPSQQQLQAFRNMPPVQALWQQRVQLAAGGSGQVLWPLCVVAEVLSAPAASNSTSSRMT